MRSFAILICLFGIAGVGFFLIEHRRNGSQVSPGGESTKATTQDNVPDMVLIPAGEFLMNQSDIKGNAPALRVKVRSFYMDKYLMTQAHYERIMGVNPSKLKDKLGPVCPTQWTDSVRFCNKCSESEGLTPCYDLKTWKCDFTANGYRLPTEAEWEYACRAGSAGKYFFGDNEAALSQFAWFKENSGGRPHPVGQKPANPWGLFDMHGNVWQWCNDYFGPENAQSNTTDNPRGPETGTQRVLRGGSYGSSADRCASSCRFKEFPTFVDACFGSDAYGFRRVRNATSAIDTEHTDTAKSSKTGPTEESTVRPGISEIGQAPAIATGKLDPSKLKGTIVFVSDRSGVLNLWMMDASGKNQRAMTSGQNPCVDPCFSPDRKRILYTSLRQGIPEVWSMASDGSDARMITEGCQGSWSPNGASVVFIRDNQTYVREIGSGKEERITPESWERCGVPSWSPDGKRIAVASRHTGTIGIFTINLSDKCISQIQTKHPSCTPYWSKDGKHLLCQTVKGHIQQVEVHGDELEQLTFGADVQHDARYSPDGSMLLFCRAPSAEGPWQIWIMPIHGEEADAVQLTSEGSNSHPDWELGD